VPDFSESTLKVLGEGVLDALFEENDLDSPDEVMKKTLRVSTIPEKVATIARSALAS